MKEGGKRFSPPKRPEYSRDAVTNEVNERILVYLGRISSQFPAIQVVIGYLMAQPQRVRFVHQIEPGRSLGLAIAVHRRIELPVAPWQGYIQGVPVPEPYTWIEAARGYSAETVAVRVSTDDPRLLALLSPLIVADKAQEERIEIRDRMQHLRKEVDQVLDIYNELRNLMAIDKARQGELAKFLGMAEDEMHHLGQELNALKERLGDSQD